MDILNYTSGSFQKGFQYQYFLPSFINHSFEWNDAQLNELLEEASYQIGQLNAFAQLVPDADMFIKMHVAKEATVSSHIEGTQTQLSEAFFRIEDVANERRDDWQEVRNYINSMNFSIEKLNELPLSNRLLKQAHAILLDGVRGKHKLPGEFRSSQNWIGGASLSDAVFIPPAHQEIDELMSDLELFLHNHDIKVPHLIKAAILHYQFETIHPFLDGNGRLGRLLIVLYLVEKKILEKPLLYISDFFDKNRMLYYDNLTRVRTHNDLRQWLLFFLVGVRDTAKKSSQTLQNIIKLKLQTTQKIGVLNGKNIKRIKLLEYLWSQPILQYLDVCDCLQVSAKTANKLIADFQSIGILVEITKGQRNRTYSFQEYLDLFEA
jgi:Fic family protein